MHLLFDLDGTLTDSFPGISRCINHALAELGRRAAPDSQIRSMVGVPLTTIFGVLLSSHEQALVDRAVAAYRARFDAVGIFENRVFPGISEALQRFRQSGHAMQVVTAKPKVPATRVVRHFGIEGYFEAIHGPALDERTCSKADLVGMAMAAAASAHAPAVMIGDRAEDIAAARAHGARAVGVGWGYGSRAELTAAGPDYLAETVADLVAWVESHNRTSQHDRRVI